jgi:hypothetical protein
VAPIVALAAEVRPSGHLHNLSYGHRRLGSLSASTERSTPVSCALTQQDTALPCMKRMRSHQADEYVAVITCARSRPETRSGREAGSPRSRTCSPPSNRADQRPRRRLPRGRGSVDRCVFSDDSSSSGRCRRYAAEGSSNAQAANPLADEGLPGRSTARRLARIARLPGSVRCVPQAEGPRGLSEMVTPLGRREAPTQGVVVGGR